MNLKKACFFLALLNAACAHQMRVETTPPDAQVFSVEKDGKRGKLLGRTPFEMNGVAASVNAIEIEHTGHIPERIIIPQGAPSSVNVNLTLSPLTETWVKTQPPDVFGKSLDMAIEDHLRLQEILLGQSDGDAAKTVKELLPKYGRLPSFHYIVGQHHLSHGRYTEAANSFRKALELDPVNDRSRRMLVLVDAKMVNSSQSDRARVISALEVAVREVAEANTGTLKKLPVAEAALTHRGFEMVLPTDNLFRKGTAKPTRDAVILAQKLVDEFRRIRFPIKVLIEGHTDSNIAEQDGIAGNSNNAPTLSLLELSSARASAFLELLQSEGAAFQLSAIAGYGNTKPVRAEVSDGVANTANQTANRRLVLKVAYQTNTGSGDLDDFFPVESAKKKASAPTNSSGTKSGPKPQPAAKKTNTNPLTNSSEVPQPRSPRVSLPSPEAGE
jgi:flagellar motor protein MotB